MFKEFLSTDNKRLQKRPKTSDTWVNSGGKRGGRVLIDADGDPAAYRRNGTIKVASGAKPLRYHQYTLIRDGEENVCTQLFHVQNIRKASETAPSGHFIVPPEIMLIQTEQEEIDQFTNLADEVDKQFERRIAKTKRQGTPVAAPSVAVSLKRPLMSCHQLLSLITAKRSVIGSMLGGH